MVAPFVTSAVVYASLFALMATGLTLTYLTTKVPNFAYGSFVTIGLYTAYTLFRIYGVNPYFASLVAFLIGGAASVVMYVGVLRPLARRGSSLVSLMIATFGLDIGFVGIFGIFTDYLSVRYRLPDTKQFFQLRGDFPLGELQGMVLVAPVALALLTTLLFILLTRTRFGVAMRASIENPPLARILGVNVERIYTFSWLLAGGFAALAGSLYTLWLPGGTNTGSDLIVEIFAASVVGGLSSLFGAVLGGIVIGGTEIIVTTDLALGFGVAGTMFIAILLIAGGAYASLKTKKRVRTRIAGLLGVILGAYIALDIALKFPFSFLAQGLVDGFGADAITYQKAIPLMIMVFALLVLPKGLVSIQWRRILRRERRD